MKKVVILAFLTSVYLNAGPATENIREPVFISTPAHSDVRSRTRGLGLDFLFSRDGRLFFIVDKNRLADLSASGISFSLETSRFAPAFPSSGPVRSGRIQGGVNGAFHSYAETETALRDIADTFPDIARVDVIGRSLEGRNISAVKLSDSVNADEDEAEILFLGCHHAREWISVEVPLLLARNLASGYAADSEIRRLLDNAEIWIVPLVNPDGLEYSIHVYRYWRKNRRDNGNGSFGVDPNRNYSFMWGIDNLGSSPDPFSLTYRGSGPFSEPETQAVRDLMETHDFAAMVSYHNYSQVILYPWGYTAAPSSLDDLMADLAAEMAARMEAVHGRIYDHGRGSANLYFTNGGTTDWALGVLGIPCFTFELPPVDIAGGGFFNAESEILPIFEENRAAAFYLIDWAIRHHPGDPAARRTNDPSIRITPKRGLRR